MAEFNFIQYRNQRVSSDNPGALASNIMSIGDFRISLGGKLDCGENIGLVAVSDIAEAANYYQQLTGGSCQPQLAALVFVASGQVRALDWYFPITNMLSPGEVSAFYQFVQHILQHPGFDLRLLGDNRTDMTSQARPDVLFIIAGQIAEIFLYRPDILERFFFTPRHFRLYTTPRAFQQDGGLAGGDYNHDTESIQLVLSRVYEGFYGATPGVAPFFHEFGHMLDFFNASSGTMGDSVGLLPGLRHEDGAIFTPKARALFLQGKQLELDRYMLRYKGIATANDPLPIGHPYVFQNDTEYCAGYLEMFLRNPNYFASMNPTLYQSYVELFRYDPRAAWRADFDFYIRENRNFYLTSGQKPWDPHLTIPTS
jgi:hypothetical protein